MLFSKYFKNLSPDEKILFAKNLDSSVNYLTQLANGHKLAGAKAAIRIETLTNGEVKRHEIRPDYFGFKKAG